MKKHHILRNIIIILCIAAAVSGICYYMWRSNVTKPVSVYPVAMLNSPYWDEETPCQATVTSGALQNIELADGLVESINVKLGDEVKKGDVIKIG